MIGPGFGLQGNGNGRFHSGATVAAQGAGKADLF